MKNKLILFICKGNSGRSQMAEAFFNFRSKSGRAISAGSNPDENVHPWTIKVMKEVGINIRRQKPKLLSDELMKSADKIVIMDSDLLANIPTKYLSKVETWQIEKLLGKQFEEIRIIRDKIKKKVEELLQTFL